MPIPLRTDFDSSALRSYAKKTKGGPQARRLLALAAVYAGATRTEAARISAPPPPIPSAPSAPKQGKGAALILPSSNIEAMNLHLAEIATEVAPGAHSLCSWSIKQGGACRTASTCQRISPSFRCRPNAPN